VATALGARAAAAAASPPVLRVDVPSPPQGALLTHGPPPSPTRALSAVLKSNSEPSLSAPLRAAAAAAAPGRDAVVAVSSSGKGSDPSVSPLSALSSPTAVDPGSAATLDTDVAQAFQREEEREAAHPAGGGANATTPTSASAPRMKKGTRASLSCISLLDEMEEMDRQVRMSHNVASSHLRFIKHSAASTRTTRFVLSVRRG
jgi:hypothetical protein